MKRRKALKQIGWGLSGSILLPSLLDACASNDPGPEINYSGTVGVIGSGAAGLYAADVLRSKGVKVIIFEAQDQLGGRVCSLRNQSILQHPYIPQLSSVFPLELGAQTIVGSNSILGKIFKDYNLTSIELAPSDNTFVLGNQAKTEGDWGNDVDFIKAKNFKSDVPNKVGSGLTVNDAAVSFGVAPRGLGMVNGQISNAHGASSTSIGIGVLAEDERLLATSGNDLKVLQLRSNPLQDILISRFSTVQDLVKLSTPISSVNYGGEKITLTAKDNSTFEVDKLIVTVPISILKSGGISFAPGLPGDFTGALAKFSMGASIRVILEFKKNFWGPATGFVWGSTEVPEYFSAGVGSEFNQTLSITVHGDKAAQYSAMSNDAIVNAIIADLDLIYAGQGTQFIRKDVNTEKNIYIIED
ncbi:MAG: NAD(P)-binding protein [Cyclobacteriaceae bacterium]|nr:NAD(P)-binding protein [Cyclobacteriaceae bacterium]